MRTPIRNVATGALAMTFVGSSVGISHALITAPLFTAQAIRYAVAVVILLAVARARQVTITKPTGTEWLWLIGIAATGLVLFNVAVVRGVAHAEPAVIAVAVASVPVVLGLLGPVLESRKPSTRILVAAAVVTAGAALVEGTGRTDAVGVGWAAVALACEAAFTLLAVPVLPRHGAWGVSVHSVWIAAVMLVVLGAATEGPDAVQQLTDAEWAAMGYLALMVTAAAFILWYSTVSALGADRAGLLTGVAPVAAALTGIATGLHAPHPLVWLGMAIVVGGLALGLGSRPIPARALTASLRSSNIGRLPSGS